MQQPQQPQQLQQPSITTPSDTYIVKSPSNTILRIVKNMIKISNNQQIYQQPIKLYSPTIYDNIVRLIKNRNNSLHTLCNTLHIYQKYKQIIQIQNSKSMKQIEGIEQKQRYKQDNIDGYRYRYRYSNNSSYNWNDNNNINYMDNNKQEIIVLACLQISQDINQFQGRRTFNKNRNQNKNKQMKQIKEIKLKIMNKLDWKFNYITFVSISQQFFNWFKKQIMEQVYVYNKQNQDKQKCNRTNSQDSQEINCQRQQQDQNKYKNQRIQSKNQRQRYNKILDFTNLQQIVMNQIEIVIQQFHFLQKTALDCACIVVSRVFKNYQIQIEIKNEDENIINENESDEKQSLQQFDKVKKYARILTGKFKQIIVKIGQNKIQKIKQQILIEDISTEEQAISQKQVSQSTNIANINQQFSINSIKNKFSIFSNIKPLKQFNRQLTSLPNIPQTSRSNSFSIFSNTSSNDINKPSLSQFRMKIISDKKIHQYFKPMKLFNLNQPTKQKLSIQQSQSAQDQFSSLQNQWKNNSNKENNKNQQLIGITRFINSN